MKATTTVTADDGNDTIKPSSSPEQLVGGRVDDAIRGGSGRDILNGGDGDDEIFGGNDNDFLNGGDGADYLDGGIDDDFMQGGKDEDTFFDRDGQDTLVGGEGDDDLDARDGNIDDTLDIRFGRDQIRADVFDNIIRFHNTTQPPPPCQISNAVTCDGVNDVIASPGL